MKFLSDAIAIHMDKWETDHSDYNLEDWHWERERFIESVAICLWHDCNSPALRKTAVFEANGKVN